MSSKGNYVYTDSIGTYSINIDPEDSISFYYGNRPTIKFPIKNISNYNGFDISLKVRSRENYKRLKEVIVYSRTYKQDSLENRFSYSKIFNYSKPGLRSDYTPGSAAVGFDLDELINIFRFRRNKQNLRFQKFVVEQEMDKYVKYRFNSLLISNLTGLKNDSLKLYTTLYKPSYDFISESSQLDLYQYIISSVMIFRKSGNNKNKDLKN